MGTGKVEQTKSVPAYPPALRIKQQVGSSLVGASPASAMANIIATPSSRSAVVVSDRDVSDDESRVVGFLKRCWLALPRQLIV